MTLQENPSNEKLDTVDKKHCSSSTVPVIIDRSQQQQQQQQQTLIENMARVQDTSYHENSFNKP
jgi:type III secretory pathway component EscV